jgi:Raf kinase inhibitor-like YbhB/YbcL family protein
VRSVAILLVSAAAVALPAACGSPAEDGGLEGAVEKSIRVESAAFKDGASIPSKFTADGANVSPALSWSGAPPLAATYALVVDDPDAPGGTWVHWVAWNLTETRLPENVPKETQIPTGGFQGKNSWNDTGYGGPSPPSGTHRYSFRVYALDAAVTLPPSAGKDELMRAIRGHVLSWGEIVGRYARGR